MSNLLLQRNIKTGELIALPSNTFATNKIFQVNVTVPVTSLTLNHGANTTNVVVRCYDNMGRSVTPQTQFSLDYITILFPSEFTGIVNLLYLSPKEPDISAILPDATQGQAYTGRLLGLSGSHPYQFSIVSGVLPDGLELDSFTGIISGIPDFTSTGQINIVCEIRDFAGFTATRSFNFNLLEGMYGRITKAGFMRITKAGNVRITKAQ